MDLLGRSENENYIKSHKIYFCLGLFYSNNTFWQKMPLTHENRVVLIDIRLLLVRPLGVEWVSLV